MNTATYTISAISLMLSRFPFATDEPSAPSLNPRKFLVEQVQFFRYLFTRPGLIVLVAFFCLVSLLNGIVLVLFRPMILTTMSHVTLGWMVSVAGVGGLLGALVAGRIAQRPDRLKSLVLAAIVSGLAMTLCGQRTDTLMITVLVFVYSLASPIALVIAQTLLQTLTPPKSQGRVFASRAFLSGITLIVAVIVAPVLAELLFEPLMMEGRPLADYLGAVIGVGPGRGMALVFILSGLLMFVIALAFAASEYRKQLNAEIEELGVAAPSVN